MSLPHLVPGWSAAARVRAACTLRSGGVSAGPYESLNTAAHVGDDAHAVAENRRRVREGLALPAEPSWLDQVHGREVIELARRAHDALPLRADGAIAREPGLVCAIQVADCMPLLFAARDGSCVGAAHAGWRGLAAGVLEATVRALGVAPRQLIAWMGPAIGPAHFEVGEEVRAAFLAHDPAAALAFSANARGRWQADLYRLARARLEALGVRQISGGGLCTFADRARFFSYRRDGRCGRMVALAWLATPPGPGSR
jgi:polyphenol oxidase